jgi:hypothetical protein
MTTFIKGAVKVFIARENVVNADYSGDYATEADGSVLAEAAVRAIASSTGGDSATRVLFPIPGVTGVSIGGFGQEFDTYQTLNDAFDHDIEIKNTGSGSCDFIMEYDRTTGAAGIAHEELKALAYYWPNGWNEEVGTTNVPHFNPTADTAVTRAADARGYCIIVQQAVGNGDNLYWCFDNCKIGCSISFANRQASRGTLTWDDARYVSFDESADELDPGVDVHSDTHAKGFN